MGPLFFWQFVNGTHGSPDCLKRVVPLERVQRFRRVRPLVAGGTPCRPFLLLEQSGEHSSQSRLIHDQRHPPFPMDSLVLYCNREPIKCLLKYIYILKSDIYFNTKNRLLIMAINPVPRGCYENIPSSHPLPGLSYFGT